MSEKETLGRIMTGEALNVRIVLAARALVNHKPNFPEGGTPKENYDFGKENDRLMKALKKAVREAEQWAREQNGTLA